MIAVVAIVVIGPKELPRALRAVGQWIGKARAMTREFQNSVNDMINESEFEELRKTANSMGDFSAGNILDRNSATNTVTPPPTPQKWPPADDATDDLGDDYDASPEEIEQWEADQARPDIIDDGEIDGDDADKPSDETDKISDNKSDETSDTKVTDA